MINIGNDEIARDVSPSLKCNVPIRNVIDINDNSDTRYTDPFRNIRDHEHNHVNCKTTICSLIIIIKILLNDYDRHHRYCPS